MGNRKVFRAEVIRELKGNYFKTLDSYVDKTIVFSVYIIDGNVKMR